MTLRLHPGGKKEATEREAWLLAMHVAQSADTLADLAALVTMHPDYRVRCEAMPRLRSRFPHEADTLDALAVASRAPDPLVRASAVVALSELGGAAAADVIAARLVDSRPEVRTAAVQALVYLGDGRAPADVDDWIRQNPVPAARHSVD
jgi:HEAT repeat protein